MSLTGFSKGGVDSLLRKSGIWIVFSGEHYIDLGGSAFSGVADCLPHVKRGTASWCDCCLFNAFVSTTRKAQSQTPKFELVDGNGS